ncbi:MAG: 4-alpha-glucanotransferase, partial [Actinomycetota bacterium]|nr:4-alpha-glucanotransferase [Actinomycetota bacterium]
EQWATYLREREWLAADADLSTDAGLDAMALALHRALAASPARLLGIALPDVIGDRRAQNQPGTDQEYPNWRVPMTDAQGTPVLLEDLFARTPAVRDFVGSLLS